jgi:IS5 family transposase
VLVRESRRVTLKVGADVGRVVDRSRALGRRLRLISRTLARRTGERKAEVLRLTEQAGRLLSRSIREARQLALAARRCARGRGARAKLAAIERFEEMTDRAQRVATQIQQRLAGEPITDRLVSMFDPDARPIRKGKLGKPNEFGYVTQLAEVTENTRRGARGFVLPPSMVVGNPQEHTLLPATISELDRLGLRPREVALDDGFQSRLIEQALTPLAPQRVFIAGRQQPGSRRTQRRLARYRVGAEGRISHLKREYELDRSRLKGEHGTRAWNASAIATHNLDTLTIRTT